MADLVKELGKMNFGKDFGDALAVLGLDNRSSPDFAFSLPMICLVLLPVVYLPLLM